MPYGELNSEEVSYEVTVEVKYLLIKHRRKKYSRGCQCGSPIVRAPKALKLFEGGLYSIDFWIKVMLDKYAYSIPLYRQQTIMTQEGLSISEGSLCSGLWKVADYLEPLYQLMLEKVAFEDLIHADETRWRNFQKCYDPARREEKTLHWLWGFFSKRYRLFVIDPTRSANVLRESLGQGEEKTITPIIVADRYKAYSSVCGLIAFCWAHVRRDFLKWQIKYPADTDLYEWCQTWLDLIGDLYAINQQRLTVINNSELFEAHQKQLEKCIKKMEKLNRQKHKHKIKQKQTESMTHHWEGLTLFVDFYEIPMDNNLAERELRGPVVGRKNFYGTHSDRATKATATFYSVIATLKLHKINLKKYLHQYFTYCAQHRTPPQKKVLKTFLPHHYAKKYPENLIMQK